MGYQESYLHTTTSNIERNNEDIQKVLEIFKKYDIRCLGDDMATCYLKVHCKKNCGKYKKGMDVLFIVGDRTAQRCNRYVFNIFEPEDAEIFTKEELKIIDRVKITFYDDILYMSQYEQNKDATEVTELRLMPELPSNMKHIEQLASTLLSRISECEKKQEDSSIYFYEIKTEEEIIKIEEIIENTVKDYGFKFAKTINEKTYNDGSIRNNYKYFINDIKFVEIYYTTMDECYVLNLFALSGKSLRELAKQLLE